MCDLGVLVEAEASEEPEALKPSLPCSEIPVQATLNPKHNPKTQELWKEGRSCLDLAKVASSAGLGFRAVGRFRLFRVLGFWLFSVFVFRVAHGFGVLCFNGGFRVSGLGI